MEYPGAGFKWPVEVVHPIAASAEKVWETISTPGNLELCHPFCDRNPVEAWPGADSRDSIEYLSGLTFERQFTRWIEGVGYDLQIGRNAGESSFVSWRITPVDDLNCTLGITVYPHVLQRVPLAIRWIPHRIRVGPLLKSYLSSVVRGFEWYVIQGVPVPHNHFGTHPWFSKRD
jgi:hypothetical protein